MIAIKSSSVRCTGFKPELIFGLLVFERIYYHFTGADLMITSGNDGDHMVGSKHYTGEAFDARSHDITANEKHQILDQAKTLLEPEFDIILESEGTENEHFHLEYDVHP